VTFVWVTVASLVAVLLVMAVSFSIGRATGKYSIIDAIWGPGFAVVAVVSFLVSMGHGEPLLRWLACVLTVVWGLRLGGYILLRNHGLPEDPRYTELLADAGPGAIVAKVQVPQGLAMWFVSMPVQVAMVLPLTFWPLVWVGVVVWAIGLTFESVGDAQLAGFKKDPKNQGQVMNRGLWRYTRHPNYFGDACVWWGLFLLVAGHWYGLLTVLSPVLMTWLLVAKTGKALTEKRMAKSKPGYADYVARTSGFFPLPPKKPALEG
jgi:steroid 5-alpha reductase family enzyme